MMNPHEWKDAIERLQRHLEPNHQSVVNSSVGNTSASSNNWNTYCDYTRYAVVEPQGSNVGRVDPSPPSPNIYRKDSKLEELDGEVVEMNEDEELARKKQQLREIEERIIHKKASIALKTVGQLVDKTTADVSCEGETLRDRVNVILQQRRPLGFLSKVQSRKDRTNSSKLSNEGLLQEQHPLKLRVKALMEQRRSDDCTLLTNTEEAPEVTPPPPSQSLTSPAKENSVNKGFERFLSILNEGVDINMLSRIVNDDRVDLPLGGELLNIQSSDVEKKSDPVFRSESRESISRTNSSEVKTDSLTERLSLPDAEEEKNDKRHHSLGSSSRSKSPPAAKKKEEEEKPKVDEKQEQLQSILKTLGLSLEVEEMSKLADRTEERLYGKKIGDRQSTDSKGEQESQQRGSNRDPSSSPSSSSSSSSSYSSSSSRSSSRSRSFGRSPPPHQRQDGSQDWEKDGMNSQQMSIYQHPYTQNQTYLFPPPPPHPPPPPPAFPDYNMLQYPHYTNDQSVAYNAASHPFWSQPPIPYPDFSAPIVPFPNTSFHHQPRQRCLENLIAFEYPNLAESEGQGKSASRPCYLQAVRTVNPSHVIGLPKRKKKRKNKGNPKTAKHKKNQMERNRQLKKYQELQESAQKGETSQGDKDDSRTNQSNEDKQQTEQEIKANLRKRLNAFNQKVKHHGHLLQPTVMQPATSLMSENG